MRDERELKLGIEEYELRGSPASTRCRFRCCCFSSNPNLSSSPNKLPKQSPIKLFSDILRPEKEVNSRALSPPSTNSLAFSSLLLAECCASPFVSVLLLGDDGKKEREFFDSVLLLVRYGSAAILNIFILLSPFAFVVFLSLETFFFVCEKKKMRENLS